MMIIDTHAHYDDEAFDADRDGLLRSLAESNIGSVINVSASLDTIKSTLKLAENYDFIYAAVGVHPDEVDDLDDGSFEDLKAASLHGKAVAIGEIGLDYYWDKQPHEVQQKWFVRQMDLAREMGLPVIFHSREAAADTMSLVRAAHAAGGLRGVMHCYSYSPEQAAEYLEMGLYLGIGGVSTFKNAKKLRTVIGEAPLDRLLLETDCPYLAPEPYRGKRNCSKYLSLVADKIAEIRGITSAEVIDATSDNARRLFKLP